MKPTTFPANTTPWRVMVPSRYFADGKRKAKYFATKEAAEEFIQRLKKFGTGAVLFDRQNRARYPERQICAVLLGA